MFPKIRNMVPPKSDHPTAVSGGIVGAILFVYLARFILSNVQSWSIFKFLTPTAVMALVMAFAVAGYLVGHCIGDQFDQLWLRWYGRANKDSSDSPPPDNVVDINDHKKHRKVSG